MSFADCGRPPLVHYGDNDLAALSAHPETFDIGSKEDYDYGQDGKGPTRDEYC